MSFSILLLISPLFSCCRKKCNPFYFPEKNPYIKGDSTRDGCLLAVALSVLRIATYQILSLGGCWGFVMHTQGSTSQPYSSLFPLFNIVFKILLLPVVYPRFSMEEELCLLNHMPRIVLSSSYAQDVSTTSWSMDAISLLSK